MSASDPTPPVRNPSTDATPADRHSTPTPGPTRRRLPWWRPAAMTRRLRHTLATILARLVIEGVIDLSEANTRLVDLGIAPLRGPRAVTFRVPATIRTRSEGPWQAISNALAAIHAETRPMRFTRFAGCPQGYRIDPPTPPPGLCYLTVHTDLRLVTTVDAHVEGQFWPTALACLDDDLDRLRRVTVTSGQVTAWPDDPWGRRPGRWEDADPFGDDHLSLAHARALDRVGHGHAFTRLDP